MALIEWVKKNKILTLVLLIVVYFAYNLVQSFFGVSLRGFNIPSTSTSMAPATTNLGSAGSSGFGEISNPTYTKEYTPQTDVENRLVIQESNLSLLVKDVTDVRNKIVGYAQDVKGYMVSSNVSNPQDAPTATVVIRIPAEKFEDALKYFHSLSIKVVSENLLGKDVTDQYVDIDKRIATYEATKARFEAILAEAKQISDITNLTQQIISIQTQIDNLKGQQMSLEKNAQLAKLTIYISTDEIALPYAPSETFRPNVIFKLAVRSLVSSLRKIASLLIWIGVYAVIWVPILAIIIFVRRRAKKKANPSV